MVYQGVLPRRSGDCRRRVRVSILDVDVLHPFLQAATSGDDLWPWLNTPAVVHTMGILETSPKLKDLVKIGISRMPLGSASMPQGPRRILGGTGPANVKTGRCTMYVPIEDDADLEAWLALDLDDPVQCLFIMHRAGSETPPPTLQPYLLRHYYGS